MSHRKRENVCVFVRMCVGVCVYVRCYRLGDLVICSMFHLSIATKCDNMKNLFVFLVGGSLAKPKKKKRTDNDVAIREVLLSKENRGYDGTNEKKNV